LLALRPGSATRICFSKDASRRFGHSARSQELAPRTSPDVHYPFTLTSIFHLCLPGVFLFATRDSLCNAN